MFFTIIDFVYPPIKIICNENDELYGTYIYFWVLLEKKNQISLFII